MELKGLQMECFIYRPFGISYASTLTQAKTDSSCTDLSEALLTCTLTCTSRPSGVCVDPTGYCYVSDTGNGLIRRISVCGHVETVETAHVLLANGDADGVALREPRGIVADALRLYVGIFPFAYSRVIRVPEHMFWTYVLAHECTHMRADACFRVDDDCRMQHVIEMAVILLRQRIVSCIESSSSPPPHKLLRRVQERQDSS